jgi:hypothetical protein
MSTERERQAIFFHYRICNGKKMLTCQKRNLGLGSEDINSAKTVLNRFGSSGKAIAFEKIDELD